MTALLRSWKIRTVFFGAVALMLFGAMALVSIKAVTVKMLPFDNKNEFQVIVDMPTGTTLEQTAAVARTLADYGAIVPEVTDYQIYIGTASPYNFNGLVRHYFMRSTSYQADIQVNLTNKNEPGAFQFLVAAGQLPTCGNGTLQLCEQCDDGNQDNNDACTNVCQPNVGGDGCLFKGVEPGDASAAASVMIDLASDPQRRERLSVASQSLQRAKFSLTGHVEALLAIYDELRVGR